MSGKNGSKPGDKIPPCPYCARPEIFEPRAATPANAERVSSKATVHISGRYWRRDEGLSRSVRTFRETVFKDGERRFNIEGESNFTEPYRGFDVEVIGLPFPFVPDYSAGPGFHRSFPLNFGETGVKMVSYNAARITHRETGVVADAHAWESHGLLVTVKNLPKNPTGSAIKAASTLLIFFSMDYRGAPKITRELIANAFKKLGGEATQAAVARELRVTERALQKWAEREGIEGWGGMRERFAPQPQQTDPNKTLELGRVRV